MDTSHFSSVLIMNSKDMSTTLGPVGARLVSKMRMVVVSALFTDRNTFGPLPTPVRSPEWTI